jgi:hypothetical protein
VSGSYALSDGVPEAASRVARSTAGQVPGSVRRHAGGVRGGGWWRTPSMRDRRRREISGLFGQSGVNGISGDLKKRHSLL